MPLVVTVGEITPVAGSETLEVELIISHARRYLRKSNPAFNRLLAAPKDVKKLNALSAGSPRQPWRSCCKCTSHS